MTGLGEEVDQIISKSPSTVKNLEELKANDWKIREGTAGKGTFTDRDNKIIYIDPNNKQNINYIVGAIAHEGGHAQYNFNPDYTSKDSFLSSTYKDEDAAMFAQIEARNEILANGGPDISNGYKTFQQYEGLYNKYKDNPDQAYQEIGNAYVENGNTSNTGEPYTIYYERLYYDQGRGSAWERRKFYKKHGKTRK